MLGPSRSSSFHFHSVSAAENPSRSICLKAFVIFTIVMGAIILVTGILSLVASRGAIPPNVNSLTELAKIGEVDASVMVGGGFVLFVLGIVSWTCHLHKEQKEQLSNNRLGL